MDEMSPSPGLRKEIVASSLQELDAETTKCFESARSVESDLSFNKR